MLSGFIIGPFDNGVEWIYVSWILTFIVEEIAFYQLDIMWTRVTIIFFSITVGILTSALFNKNIADGIVQDIFEAQDGMTVPENVAISFAIAAFLITIFDIFHSAFEKKIKYKMK